MTDEAIQVQGDMRPSTTAAILPVMAVVFIAFLVIGLALPVLPLHVSFDLGFGAFVVGLVTGSQFGASLLSRIWAGRYSDRNGGRHGVLVGLAAAVAGGLLYLASLGLSAKPTASLAVLLLGRAVLGASESFVITGAVSWGLAIAGPGGAGKVIAWMGMAMFAALAAGAPAGTALYQAGGFTTVAWSTTAVPLASIAIVLLLPGVEPVAAGARSSLAKVGRAVWMPGLGAAFSSLGLGAILAFGSLLTVERGWAPVWLIFTTYAVALIVARLLFGHLPDRFGGAPVALASALVEVVGLALIWLAASPVMVGMGAALAGIGYALVYPALGVEAVRRSPPESRGLVMGLYTAFLDIALGLGTLALGLVAGLSGIASVFLVSALVALGTLAVAVALVSGSQRNGISRRRHR